eukprot:3937123-Rhodomonas_salina.2
MSVPDIAYQALREIDPPRYAGGVRTRLSGTRRVLDEYVLVTPPNAVASTDSTPYSPYSVSVPGTAQSIRPMSVPGFA